ncbi:PspC domain-containing protein [Shewanella glacialipiscicola]|uniref:PspC domain-containing protein n=1 Tax=Shewanella glacialipiscicola TaxID=614069 RepID=UPI003D7BDBE8
MESLDNVKVLTRGESVILAGVCSGIAKYYNLRKSSIRFAFLLTSLFFAIPVFAYIVLWLVLPKYPTTEAMARHLRRNKLQRKYGS